MSTTGHRALSFLAARAWSRAGAVAQVLVAHPARRSFPLVTRFALLLVGSAAIGCAIAVMVWNDLGPGPLDVLVVAIRDRTGLGLAVAMWLTIGVLVVIAALIGRAPGAGTLLAPILIGPVAQVVLERLDDGAPSGSIGVRLLIHLAAIGVAGIGAATIIVAGLGAGTGELLATAAADRSGHSEPRVRLAFEAAFVVVGVLLGGPIGVGTVLFVAVIGQAVAFGYRLVDRATAPLRSSG